MTPKRTKQSSITSMGFPFLQKPVEMCVGRQIKVLGSYWKGCMRWTWMDRASEKPEDPIPIAYFL
jgi:hypothetical protein